MNLPDSVRRIEPKCFCSCGSLLFVIFGQNSRLKWICRQAFDSCFSLSRCEVPKSLIGLGERAFSECMMLTSFVFPVESSLEFIGPHCFEDVCGLKIIELPSTVLKISKSAFHKCKDPLSSYFVRRRQKVSKINARVVRQMMNMMMLHHWKRRKERKGCSRHSAHLRYISGARKLMIFAALPSPPSWFAQGNDRVIPLQVHIDVGRPCHISFKDL